MNGEVCNGMGVSPKVDQVVGKQAKGKEEK